MRTERHRAGRPAAPPVLWAVFREPKSPGSPSSRLAGPFVSRIAAEILATTASAFGIADAVASRLPGSSPPMPPLHDGLQPGDAIMAPDAPECA